MDKGLGRWLGKGVRIGEREGVGPSLRGQGQGRGPGKGTRAPVRSVGQGLGPGALGVPPCAPCVRSAVSFPLRASCTPLCSAHASCALGTRSPPDIAAGSGGREGPAGIYCGSVPELRAQIWTAGPGHRVLGDRWEGSGTVGVSDSGARRPWHLGRTPRDQRAGTLAMSWAVSASWFTTCSSSSSCFVFTTSASMESRWFSKRRLSS